MLRKMLGGGTLEGMDVGREEDEGHGERTQDGMRETDLLNIKPRPNIQEHGIRRGQRAGDVEGWGEWDEEFFA